MLSVHFHAEKRRWSMSPFALFPSYNNIGWYPILSIIGTYNWSLTILCYSLIIIGIYDRLQRETWLKIEKLDSKGIKSVFLNFLKSRWTPTFNVLKIFFCAIIVNKVVIECLELQAWKILCILLHDANHPIIFQYYAPYCTYNLSLASI